MLKREKSQGGRSDIESREGEEKCKKNGRKEREEEMTGIGEMRRRETSKNTVKGNDKDENTRRGGNWRTNIVQGLERKRERETRKEKRRR